MTRSLATRPPRFPQGLGGVALALPVLDAMGAEVTDQIPRRFCAIYTANGMSLPKAEHGIDEWSWFPDRRARTANSSSANRPSRSRPFRKQLSFLGGLYHPNGPKADPHICSDMWLTGAPLHNPKPGTYNSVGLDQVIALHTKQYCRQPSLVLSIDAGTGYPLAHRHDLLQPRRPADPGGEQSAPRLRPPVPRRPHVARSRAREAAAAHQAGGRRGRERQVARPATRQDRSRADGPVPDLARTKWNRG